MGSNETPVPGYEKTISNYIRFWGRMAASIKSLDEKTFRYCELQGFRIEASINPDAAVESADSASRFEQMMVVNLVSEGFMAETQNWMKVVEAIAGYVALGLDEEEIFEGYLRQSLLQEGHPQTDVDYALDWLERAAHSGNLSEVLCMMQSATVGARIESPLERACFSDAIWQDIIRLRAKGLVGQEVVERLVEGIRNIDARDWDDEEVRALIMDVMSKSLPGRSHSDLERILGGRERNFYS